MKEAWKKHKTGLLVSNKGRVKGTTGKLLTPWWCVNPHNGVRYLRVASYDKKHTQIPIHRLVLETFVGPCPHNHQTRHLDGDVSNNKLSNLTWGTRSENQLDKKHTGHFNRKDYGRKKRPLGKRAAGDIRTLFGLGYTLKELAELYNCSIYAISKIVNNRSYFDPFYDKPKINATERIRRSVKIRNGEIP